MSKLLLVQTRGPEDPIRAGRGFQFAKIAAHKGHAVTMFPVDAAAYCANLSWTDFRKGP